MPRTEVELEEQLSRPTPLSVGAMKSLDGDLLILGVGGKMGPSLARLARRSADEAGRRDLKVVGVARFSSSGLQEELRRDGIETIACDLLDEAARRRLPQLPNVLFMLGHKFSQRDLPGQYWAMNTFLPGLLAEQYQNCKIVCFSSGNVYPFVPAAGPAPTEEHPCGPVGEYAISTWGRERMLEYVSARSGTKVCLLRLNYAVEGRYGVLVDIGLKLLAGEPIDLTTPCLNYIWQGYANAVALGSFGIASSPAKILNLTGPARHQVRDLALALAQRLGVEPRFVGTPGPSALISDATQCLKRFGPPEIDDQGMLDLVADWLLHGGRTLGKPTRFEVRDGKY